MEQQRPLGCVVCKANTVGVCCEHQQQRVDGELGKLWHLAYERAHVGNVRFAEIAVRCECDVPNAERDGTGRFEVFSERMRKGDRIDKIHGGDESGTCIQHHLAGRMEIAV